MPGAGLIHQPAGRSIVVGQSPAIDRYLHHLASGGRQGHGRRRRQRPVQLQGYPQAANVAGQDVGNKLFQPLAGRLPAHRESGRRQRAGGLGSTGQ